MGRCFPVPPSPGVDLALEKKGNVCKKIVNIKKVDLFLQILPDSNQIRTENTVKNIEKSIFSSPEPKAPGELIG